ncbi:hypothetical protein QFC21_003454 [Naganishia friedmannii]|uniref:Uncharacterized protein n=1 Tax=Naganishia friedmannii TaxID=89922 RepID=A0ACC2VQR9_9TREE|nr:hypothetical protein QFC21_003454 [Naganishia friedmannii]
MRFRTQISNPGLMLKIIKSLKQTANTCVLKLSPEVVGFIVTGPESTLFEQYRIESRQANEIHLELSIDSLTKALRSAEAAVESSSAARGGAWGDAGEGEDGAGMGGSGVVMKLAKKNDRAVLVFEIRAFVNHDVGVTVLAPIKVKELREPCCPTPDKGTLQFSVENDGMQLDTTWTNLQIPPFTTSSSTSTEAQGGDAADGAPREASQLVHSANPNPDAAHGSQQQQQQQRAKGDGAAVAQEVPETSDQMYQVTIGTKSLLRFLSTNVSNSGTIACDVADNAGVLTIFIPKMQD